MTIIRNVIRNGVIRPVIRGVIRTVGGLLDMLLHTGQMTSYRANDDGAYQIGLAHSYTALDTGQYAGSVNITINAKTNSHTNACVQDNVTGLMWSKVVSLNVGPASDGKLLWEDDVNVEGIFDYEDAANIALLANYSDWRIPNMIELISLLNVEFPNAVPEPLFFPGYPVGDVWTSTRQANNTANAIRVGFANPVVGGDLLTREKYVHLVRGGI